MLAVFGVNALGIIYKPITAHNTVIMGKRIKGIEFNSKIKFKEFNELQTISGLFVR
jgi:hypothetical protein